MSTLFGSSSTFGDVKSAWLFGDEREDTSAAGSFTTSDASSDAPDAPLSEEGSFLSAIDTFPAMSTGGASSEECFACWGAELAGSASCRPASPRQGPPEEQILPELHPARRVHDARRARRRRRHQRLPRVWQRAASRVDDGPDGDVAVAPRESHRHLQGIR